VLLDSPPQLIVKSDFTLQGGADAMVLLLDRCPGLDTVFVASSLMATGALRVVRERGCSVPKDVAVVGFDNLAPIAEATSPPLTTVHQDIEGMGRLMARLLFNRTPASPCRKGVTTRCPPDGASCGRPKEPRPKAWRRLRRPRCCRPQLTSVCVASPAEGSL
jgi:DNA-binding LacI/PurR family transcriptional regulator